MHKKNDLLIRIEENYIRLSKGQKRIAEYILENYNKVAFMTASVLGDIVGVSESTVVRFANALGYDGYPKLQKGLQESIKTKLTTVQRFELSKENDPSENYIKKIMSYDINNIKKTIDMLDEDLIKKIGDSIHSAKRVYILGMRSSSVLANYLGFYLNFIREDVNIISIGVQDVFDYLFKIGEDDLLIAISFPRYAKQTFEIVNFAKSRKAKLVGLTDSELSPLYQLVDDCLIAKYNMNTFIDSLVAPMSLINALIISLSIENKDSVEKNFNDLENLWNEYKIYNPNI
ncbi:MurR/RpiR family transcriptional regulator [Helicovermis profundi]|uniref:MurR/RpiR family transcriptional regulator n=1 Tax=Helicovermis profundi TaxID=3065157 RepID=A0AAU9E8K6_9FIRM|nr:MurR/RpiR family transcriptional regulator [Clostridia bacterium S502]